MTTATASLTPMEDWDNEPLFPYVTPARAAGAVAFTLLAHSANLGPDIVRVRHAAEPDGLESDDMFGFLWDLIQDAAEIGYTMAQIKTDGFGLPYEGAEVRTSDMARAIAALLRRDLVEDGQPFDPEYREKRDSEGKAA